MVRRHDESVSVRVGGDWGDGARAGSDDGPRDFVWRGRRYTVCAVLASWQERRAWWRDGPDRRC